MQRKIRLIYVVIAALTIIICGKMTLNSLDEDIAVLEDEAREKRLIQLELEAEKSDMQREIAMKDTDSYIRNIARSVYGYMTPGEILFKVSNPEALYGEGETPQLDVTIAEEAADTADTAEIAVTEETEV